MAYQDEYKPIDVRDQQLATKFLIFYLFETWEKLLQVDAFVHAPEHRQSRGKQPVIQNLSDALMSLGKELSESVSYYRSLAAGEELVLTEFARSIKSIDDVFNALLRIHQQLNLLSGAGKGESQVTYDFIRKLAVDTMGNLPRKSSWLPYVPSIALTDQYAFTEHDLRSILSSQLESAGFSAMPPRGRDVVLALPKAEAENPLMWAILAHEISHTMIDSYRILDRVLEATPGYSGADGTSQRVYRNWAVEVCADLIALRLLGPSYFFSFASMAFLLGEFTSTQTHPSAIDRIGFMERVIQKHHPDWAIECPEVKCEKFTTYELISFFLRLIDFKWALWTSDEGREVFNYTVPEPPDVALQPDKDLIVKVLDETLVPVAKLSPKEQREQVLKTLLKKQPISSLGAPDFDAERFEESLNQVSTADELYEVLPEPEEPLTLSTILGCGWMLKIYYDYGNLLDSIDSGRMLNQLEEAHKDAINIRNQLLQSSLTRAFMMQMYWKWRESSL
jgi:hypothetical protein